MPFEVLFLNQETPTSTVIPIDPDLLPSRPRILTAIYDFNTNDFYVKWLLDNNGGSNITQITIRFLTYDINGVFGSVITRSNWYGFYLLK